ncbi:hypothetical protein [Bradyrhizobium sp. CCBAU 51753]|uniref:hypothetical protein n=1 Tax=Bradyrhizobium sp. CCBAU 51753 TaxID=1325100 RepID=UPI00188D13D8|nr:hypothetical protein [Bradyrhizobium sp. CCBAU 51753]
MNNNLITSTAAHVIWSIGNEQRLASERGAYEEAVRLRLVALPQTFAVNKIVPRLGDAWAKCR